MNFEIGFGLRRPHYAEILREGVRVPVVECISENLFQMRGRPFRVVERARQNAELLLHGVSLSIGDMDEIPTDTLKELRELDSILEAKVISDHLCFGRAHGRRGFDLWPLPMNEAMISHLVARIGRVQDVLGRRIALENISAYCRFEADEMSEVEFINQICLRADCLLLLDLNNLLVNERNFNQPATEFLQELDLSRIAQVHVGGHSDLGTHAFDDHASPPSDACIQLFVHLTQLLQATELNLKNTDVFTILEWDGNIPKIERFYQETQRLKKSIAGMRATKSMNTKIDDSLFNLEKAEREGVRI